MKTKVTLALVLSVLFTACDNGKLEYGYSQNPKGIFIKIIKDLRISEYDTDWITLFSGKMICYYGSEEGPELLKKTLGDITSVDINYTLEEPQLLKTGTSIAGHEQVLGKILKGEVYQTRVLRNVTNRPVFTITMSCFKENSGDATRQYCVITNLINHDYGNPNVPICEQ